MNSLEFDSRHLWHPYSSALAPTPVHQVREADGVWLTLEDGTQLIDAMSSWWCALHGHRHPAIVSAMEAQLHRMPHVMFAGLTHEPAIEVGRRLVALLPGALDRIFYCDSGSVAVEVAMKMAVQYQMARHETGRTRFATIRSGYHGDTWQAMSVCDPVTGMHGLFQDAVTPQYYLPVPPVDFHADWPADPEVNGLADLRRLLEAEGARIAGLVLEPVVQGAGGMRFYHPEYLRGAAELCRAYGVLLIFDEIATGFGRTGAMFAMDHCGVTPDIVCLGKALTGGHLSFAVTVASNEVAETISRGEAGVFMHGPTFMANPLACSAAIASLDLLASGEWRNQVGAIEQQLADELAPARALPGVADVRVLGALGVIEMEQPMDPDVAHRAARRTGVYLRPFGRNIYTMPPFITAPEELARITAAMVALAQTA